MTAVGTFVRAAIALAWMVLFQFSPRWKAQRWHLLIRSTPLRWPKILEVADIYPIKGVWVAPNPDFPIRSDEACITVRLSGIEAVTRKFIAELLIFNENKRYEVRQNTRTVSTLFSMKPAADGFWVTELSDVRNRFWLRQKINYLLTIIDPTTIEIRNNSRRAKFVKCSPRGKLPI